MWWDNERKRNLAFGGLYAYISFLAVVSKIGGHFRLDFRFSDIWLKRTNMVNRNWQNSKHISYPATGLINWFFIESKEGLFVPSVCSASQWSPIAHIRPIDRALTNFLYCVVFYNDYLIYNVCWLVDINAMKWVRTRAMGSYVIVVKLSIFQVWWPRFQSKTDKYAWPSFQRWKLLIHRPDVLYSWTTL